jgi:hypothetical protein
MPRKYFASTRARKAVRWSSLPTGARVRGGAPAKAKAKRKKPSTHEHDAQVALFDDHLRVRLVPGAVAFAVGNGGKRHASVARR